MYILQSSSIKAKLNSQINVDMTRQNRGSNQFKIAFATEAAGTQQGRFPLPDIKIETKLSCFARQLAGGWRFPEKLQQLTPGRRLLRTMHRTTPPCHEDRHQTIATIPPTKRLP